MSDLNQYYVHAQAVGDDTDPSFVKPLVDTLKFLLIDSGYIVSLSTHRYVSDVGSSHIVARSNALTGKTVGADGVVTSDPTTIAGVTGNTITQLWLYKDTGSDATSPLIWWCNSANGLADTPNGSPITITPDAGSSQWFTL